MVIFSMFTFCLYSFTRSVSLSPPLPLSLALFPFICLSLWKGAYAYSSYIFGWCLCVCELDKGSGFVLNLLLWCGTLFCLSLVFFFCFLYTNFFFLFENASSNPITQRGWNGKTQMHNPLHHYRKTSLKQNREKGRETDNTLKGYSYSSMYQNSSPLLIIVLFASFQGSVHVFVFLYSVGYLTYSVYAYFLYAWVSADHLPKCVAWILCGIMSTFFIDIFWLKLLH